jgi:hypothetical protein
MFIFPNFQYAVVVIQQLFKLKKILNLPYSFLNMATVHHLTVKTFTALKYLSIFAAHFINKYRYEKNSFVLIAHGNRICCHSAKGSLHGIQPEERLARGIAPG